MVDDIVDVWSEGGHQGPAQMFGGMEALEVPYLKIAFFADGEEARQAG